MINLTNKAIILSTANDSRVRIETSGLIARPRLDWVPAGIVKVEGCDIPFAMSHCDAVENLPFEEGDFFVERNVFEILHLVKTHPNARYFTHGPGCVVPLGTGTYRVTKLIIFQSGITPQSV